MNWIIGGIFLLALIILIVVAEIIRKRLNGKTETTRKIVHIATGLFIVTTPFMFDSNQPILAITLIFIPIIYCAIKWNLFKSLHGTDRKSYGTVYYPLAFLILTFFLWEHFKVVLVTSILILAVADAIAAIIGNRIKNPIKYMFGSESKSVQGSFAMFIVSVIITFFSLYYLDILDNSVISAKIAFWIAILTGVIATACEAVSYKGSDNLTVPLGASFTIHYILTHTTNIEGFALGVCLALFIAVISFYLKFLDGSGSVATFLLGVVVFGIGGWKFALPILAFFVLSSIISKIGKHQKRKLSEKFQKSSQRDMWQVLANGGIGGIAVLMWNYFPDNIWYFVFVGSIAAANADTWGTEIGVFSKVQPRHILNFKPVPVGSSGGVSLLGTCGALLGSVVIALIAVIFEKMFAATLLVVAAGFLGSIIDSIVGATIQAQYKCSSCGKITEKTNHCNGMETKLISGWKWIDNDMVNGICTLSGAIMVWIGGTWLDIPGF